MVNKRTTLLLMAVINVLAVPLSSHAQSTKPPLTVSELDAIMQEEILLKAKANRAKQRAELGRFDSAAQTADVANPTLPQLAWRRSTATGWLAKLYLSDGSSVIASRGDMLPGGYVVDQINEQGVKIKRNDELIDLTAASSGSRTSEQAKPQTGAPGISPYVPAPQGRLP